MHAANQYHRDLVAQKLMQTKKCLAGYHASIIGDTKAC